MKITWLNGVIGLSILIAIAVIIFKVRMYFIMKKVNKIKNEMDKEYAKQESYLGVYENGK